MLLDQLLWLPPLHRPEPTTSPLGFRWPLLRDHSSTGIALSPLALPVLIAECQGTQDRRRPPFCCQNKDLLCRIWMAAAQGWVSEGGALSSQVGE